MPAQLTQQESDRLFTEWARDKTDVPAVRNIMVMLAYAELAGPVLGFPMGTRFFKGPKPRDLDLDALYGAAVAALSASKKRRRQSEAAKRETKPMEAQI
jgi:hypothetical protein